MSTCYYGQSVGYGMGRDRLVIYYENDGEDIALYMQEKLSDERYNCQVSIIDVSDDHLTAPMDAKLSVLLLTPEMEEFLQNTEKKRVSDLSFSPSSSVLLRYGIDVEDETNSLLASRFKGFKKWASVELGTTADDFKQAMIQIMQLVDKPPSLNRVSIVPKTVHSPQDDICIMFKKEIYGEVTVWINEDRIEIKARRLNPFTYSFKLKGSSPGPKHIEIFEDHDSLGTKTLNYLSKLYAIECMLYDVNNPQELLCQVLRVDSLDDLDLEMCDILGDNKDSTGTMHEIDAISKNFTVEVSKNELPTLLHFGAKYGLRRFCERILHCPGSKIALNIKNKFNLTPSSLAKQEGFNKLSVYLKSLVDMEENDDCYMEMNFPTPDKIPDPCISSTATAFHHQPGRNTFTAPVMVRPPKTHVCRSKTLDGCSSYQRSEEYGNFNRKETTLPRDSQMSSISSCSGDSGVSVTESQYNVIYRNMDIKQSRITERMSLMWEDLNWRPPPPPRDIVHDNRPRPHLPQRVSPAPDEITESTKM